MSRYVGPKVKKMRAVGIDLPGLSRKTIEHRPYPPGDHGQGRRTRISEYGLQLKEKQRLVFNYGMGERPFRRYVKEALASKKPTGEKLIELLERRLDNAVFRAGFAPTIPAARQLVRHRHILLNGKRVNIPSIQICVGDVIQPGEKGRELLVVQDSLERMQIERPDWMVFEHAEMKATVNGLPDSVPFEIDVQQVVGYYSKRL